MNPTSPKLNLAELWEQWRQRQRVMADHAEKHRLYDPKMAGSRPGVDADRVNKYYENELQKQNEGGER